MKHVLAWAVAACIPMSVSASGLQCAADPEAFQAMRAQVLRPPAGQIIVVAHRGCFAAAPENTPLAIEHCARMGVEVVENDVRMSADGELFVLHDATIDRVTTGSGELEKLTTGDLAMLRMRIGAGGPDSAISDQPVPTLRQYFRAARHRVMINLEFKPTAKVDWETLLARSLQIAREEGVIDHLLIKVPDAMHHGKAMGRSLLASVRFPPDVSLLPIIWQSDAPIAARLDALEPFGGVGYEIPITDPAYLGQVRDEPRLAGRPVMAVAVQPQWSGGLDDRTSLSDPDAGWGQLIALGANLIMTDQPEALIAYLRAKGKRAKPVSKCD